MVGRPAAAAGGGGLILGDRQAQGACWDYEWLQTTPVDESVASPVAGSLVRHEWIFGSLGTSEGEKSLGGKRSTNSSRVFHCGKWISSLPFLHSS
jgi:hypothetical protein